MPKLDKNKILEKVKVNKKITLQILANKIDIPFDEIKKFNICYKKYLLAVDGPSYILLPKKYIKKFCSFYF